MWLTQSQWDECDALNAMQAQIWKDFKLRPNHDPALKLEYERRLAAHLDKVRKSFSHP
jgi:hypothetical protein